MLGADGRIEKKGLASRFGFLKGAVGMVKGVWNRGAGTGAREGAGSSAASAETRRSSSTNGNVNGKEDVIPDLMAA